MSEADLMRAVDAYTAGEDSQVPDVAQGHSHVYITRWGSWAPVFSMTPDEAIIFASQVSRAGKRILDEQRSGQVTEATHADLVALRAGADQFDPVTLTRPPHPMRWYERDLAIFIAGLGVAVIVWWLWTVAA